MMGALPAVLASRGHRVMVVVPLYDDYEGVEDSGVSVMTLGRGRTVLD